MKMTKNTRKIFSVVISLVLTAAMALIMTACGNSAVTSDPASAPDTVSDTVKVVGTGATEFDFTVTELDGKKTEFTVKTDKKTVGEALIDNKLIEGENGDYGLYVKKVNGIVADFDTDGTYWAFYVNGDYATSGVDTTEIKTGEKYEFRISK